MVVQADWEFFRAHLPCDFRERAILLKVARNPPSKASRQWVDFVRHVLNSERVRSRAERLNLASAVPAPKKGESMTESHPRAFIAKPNEFPGALETFVAMDFDDTGGVTIWTDKHVHVLERTGMEGFVMIARDPTDF